MSDQADRLRQLVGASRAAATFAALADDRPVRGRRDRCRERHRTRTTRSLLFTSGKGGVGTSNLVLNLAIALGEMGQRVVVVDADLGLANLDLLCGLTPRYDLGDVLAGRCRLFDAVVTGPGEIQIVPGAHAIRTGAEDLGEAPARLVARAERAGGRSPTSCWWTRARAWGPGSTMLAAAADQAVIVSTPEPTSIADAHAAISRFRRLAAPPRLRVLVNQAASASEAADVLDRLVASSRQFLGAVVSPLGTGLGPGRPPRPPGGPRPPAVLDGLSATRSPRAASDGWPAPWSGNAIRRPASRRAGFFAALAARWASLVPRQATRR